MNAKVTHQPAIGNNQLLFSTPPLNNTLFKEKAARSQNLQTLSLILISVNLKQETKFLPHLSRECLLPVNSAQFIR